MWYCPCGIPLCPVCPSCSCPIHYQLLPPPFPLPYPPGRLHHLKRPFLYYIPQRPPRTHVHARYHVHHSFSVSLSLSLSIPIGVFQSLSLVSVCHSQTLIRPHKLTHTHRFAPSLRLGRYSCHSSSLLRPSPTPNHPSHPSSPPTFPVHSSPFSCSVLVYVASSTHGVSRHCTYSGHCGTLKG